VATGELPDEIVELIAKRFRVIGEPVRIRLLNALRDGEHSVGELTDLVGGSQQNVSKHLGVLHDARIVSRRKSATNVLYSIVDDSVFRMCEDVCGAIQRDFDQLSRLAKAGAR
jgi:DNA-binding transcriptional ArsR family regulator